MKTLDIKPKHNKYRSSWHMWNLSVVILEIRNVKLVNAMARLSQREHIELLMMIGYGGRLSTHQEACDVFNDTYPEEQISRFTVRLVARYDKTPSVADLPRSGRLSTSQIKCQIKYSPRKCGKPAFFSTRHLAFDHNMSQTSVIHLLKKEEYHPYKVQLIHELNEDGSQSALRVL
ncbi:hypothetical protein NQ317_006096 [Molorchus minor]|uniref:Uncharacterized protein n=1 Tax=Molorchus minor TaxID=1323400 RepID=A0ABQ9K0A5_9CUCU|nr:hypothetical protein NQ317_006096 [Molorchus minor]